MGIAETVFWAIKTSWVEVALFSLAPASRVEGGISSSSDELEERPSLFFCALFHICLGQGAVNPLFVFPLNRFPPESLRGIMVMKAGAALINSRGGSK